MKTIFVIAAGFLMAIGSTKFADARGFGGAHGGEASASHSGSYSGSHYSGSHEGSTSGGAHSDSREGSYHGANYSGAHEESGSVAHEGGAVAGSESVHHVGETEAGGVHAEGFEAGGYHAGGYHVGGVEATGYHGALPTDAGFGAGAVGVHATAVTGNHWTQPVNSSVTAARGAAVRNSYSGAGTFDRGWYGAHPGAWTATGWGAGQAWHPAAWASVGPALGWAANVQPIPYIYGTNVTYQGDQVYSGDQPIATTDQYYQQAATIAQNPPATDDQSPDWTPLGVFALVQNDQEDPHYVMQIAVNKSGALGGNYVDLISDTILPLHGSVDKKTQRVAWIVGNNKKNVGEAGLYNLTQGEAPALIHQGSDKTQQWLLVRLKQPE